VGSVIPRKGQDTLVRALERIRAMPWSCVCAGGLDRAPEFARAVLERVKRAGLDDRIEFPGECGEVVLDDLYHGASLFVLPSHYEGYGMAFAEALVRGLPVVGTTGGAVPYTVPSSASILVPPGDEAALGDALGHLLAGSAGAGRRAKLASAARQHALKLPGWARAVGLFARAILELTPDR
jgi:glycosyltransferase involved in cell wall biosynthesis